MTRPVCIPLALFMTVLIPLWASRPGNASGDDWPNWRGPHADGVAAGDKYPVEWSTSENVLWRFTLPGIGASTPVILGNQIIVTCEKDGKNAILCTDRAGSAVWEVPLGEYRGARNRKASGCNSSPVSDGKFVFAYFKSGELAGLDMSGKLLWQTNLQTKYGEDTLWWDLGTSPVLTKDCVVVAVMQTGGSYLVAMEKATGKVVWKQDRNLDAPGESAQSYTTPLVLTEDGKEIIIVLGADHVTAHDAATGQQIWVAGGLNPRRIQNYRSIASPVVDQGMVIAPYSRGRSLTAIRLGGKDDVTQSHVAWTIDDAAADVPCPVAADGKIFTCSDRGRVSMIDTKSGNILASVELPRSRSAFSASPVLAGGHLYVANEAGMVFVLKVGDELELVAENDMEDFIVATPVFCDGRIYIRMDEYLYCIGDQ